MLEKPVNTVKSCRKCGRPEYSYDINSFLINHTTTQYEFELDKLKIICINCGYYYLKDPRDFKEKE